MECELLNESKKPPRVGTRTLLQEKDGYTMDTVIMSEN